MLSTMVEPERTQLPKLILRYRGGQDSFFAYVNAVVVSKTRHDVDVRGRGALYMLYSLSMVAPRGQNSALQALYAALVNNPPGTLYLEGVGEVMLFSHRADLVEQGQARLHWTYRQQAVPLPAGAPGAKAARALQGVIECEMATNADPLAAEQQALRTSQKHGGEGGGGVTTAKKGGGGGGKKPADNVTLSTARKQEIKDKLQGKQAAAGGTTPTTTVVQQGENRPLFLLFVPGAWAAAGMTPQEQEERLAQLYLSFLDKRFELPLLTEWGLPLYRAALSECQVEPLHVWSYPQSFLSDKTQVLALPEGAQPFIKEAYLCRPDPARVMQQVMALVRKDAHQREEPPVGGDSFRRVAAAIPTARELAEIGA